MRECGLEPSLLSLFNLPGVGGHPRVFFRTLILGPLYHRQNTVLHHRLDVTGVIITAPAIFDAAFSFHQKVSLPSSVIRLVAFVTPLLYLILMNHEPGTGFRDVLWAVTGTYTGLAVIAYIYHRKAINAFVYLGVAAIITGVILLLVAENDVYWGCIPTQLSDPHLWGHFFSAAAVTLLSRRATGGVTSKDYTLLLGSE